jgi:hypothetical protein
MIVFSARYDSIWTLTIEIHIHKDTYEYTYTCIEKHMLLPPGTSAKDAAAFMLTSSCGSTRMTSTECHKRLSPPYQHHVIPSPRSPLSSLSSKIHLMPSSSRLCLPNKSTTAGPLVATVLVTATWVSHTSPTLRGLVCATTSKGSSTSVPMITMPMSYPTILRCYSSGMLTCASFELPTAVGATTS